MLAQLKAEQVNVAQRDSLFARWYPALLLTLWVLLPEVRRIVDWRVGFNSLSIINILPMVALLPLIPIVFRAGLGRIAFGFKVVATLWVASFGYAMLVGWLSGKLFGAAYECALFMLPLFVGLWLASMDPEPAKRIYARFVTAAIWLSVVVSLYGIYQYISPSQWDVYWMVNSGLTSIGNPAPFEVRVFSTLNSPLTCADFLALTILLALYRLRAQTLWYIAPFLLSITALILTLVRTAWLEVGIGVIIFVCLSPRRSVVLGTAALTFFVTLVVATNLGTITGNPQLALEVQDRLSTFSDLKNDGSADQRQYGTAVTVHYSLEEPLGQGLGFGSGAKLSGGSTQNAASAVDTENGYAMRLLEMGVFGFMLYIASVGSALVTSIMWLRRAAAASLEAQTIFYATSVTVQIALIGADVSADHHLSLMGIFYWILVGLGSAISVQLPSGRATPVFAASRGLNGPAGAL